MKIDQTTNFVSSTQGNDLGGTTKDIPVPLLRVSLSADEERGCRREMETEIKAGCLVAGRPQASVSGRTVWRFLTSILEGASVEARRCMACGVSSGGIVVDLSWSL